MINFMSSKDSCFLSKYGTSDGGKHILDNLRNMDFSKYKVNDNSKNYLIGVLDRKVSNESKNDILRLLANGTIELILCNKEDGMPNYIFSFPMGVGNGKMKFFINIGYYAKYKKETGEVLDIDPRILFALLTYGYNQYKLYTDPAKIHSIKLADVVLSSYKKIFNRIMGKIVSLNTLTIEEKMNYDVLLNTYVLKVLLRKNDNEAAATVFNVMTKTYADKDKVKNAIQNLDTEKINSLDTFIDLVLKYCPSFKKVSTVLILREYTISMKATAVLSIDLIQVFIPVLMAINVGSSGIFNDKFVESVLDSNELNQIKIAMSRSL